jgi:hypothetical protein
MADLLAGDDENRDLTYDDAYRSYLITRRDPSSDYRFGRTHGKRVRVRARAALRRVNGYLKNMIEAIANAKARRMERERTARDRYDRPNEQRAHITFGRPLTMKRGPRSPTSSSVLDHTCHEICQRIRCRFPPAPCRQRRADLWAHPGMAQPGDTGRKIIICAVPARNGVKSISSIVLPPAA